MTAGDNSATALRRKRIIRLLRCFIVGAILHIPIVIIFSFTILKVRNPKIQLESVAVETLTVNSSSNSFSMTLNAKITVKNTNFGPFKYDNSTAVLSYREKPVGVVGINGGQAGLRSTKKVDVVITVMSSEEMIGDDLYSGKVTLTAEATVEGKVVILWFMKKKNKLVGLNCTMDFNIVAKSVDGLLCN
ncbi:late embryogenesis abundant protein At1g64065-like [Impatiens glandulifera]|uniref:late embryogenesis abundant protein At1g64065-like n=1 Tax=Impatiens glandulifera TaxID=253017 RepID=UPI001FB0D2D1|nr:late embryogenesis abundant protein At1g64065-like [Impatiens glandulifera]